MQSFTIHKEADIGTMESDSIHSWANASENSFTNTPALVEHLAPTKISGFEQIMRHGAKCCQREWLRDDIGPRPALKVKLSEGQICDVPLSINSKYCQE
jgi:hypothetical protein